MEAVTAGSKQ